MTDFFASAYEWFGVMPLYSKGMMERLRGWDVTCTDYIASPIYTYAAWCTIGSVLFIYALQYHILDSSRGNKKLHLWLYALSVVAVNFLGACLYTNSLVQSDDFCPSDNLSVSDCLGFGFSNALWSFILFLFITSVPWPRGFSTNCRHTTFLTL